MTNSRTPYHELAAKLGLSINAVHKRIKAMMDSGIIRTFTARPSLTSIEAISVWVFGRSETPHPSEVHLGLKTNDSTYWVANSGGGYVYVGGYLRSLSELEPYVAFVKREGGITDPTVGIVPYPTNRFPEDKLSELDYQILASLHKDSRKPVSDVASEVNASAKTVHRRLERMIEKSLVDLSIDWYPDASNDIVALCHATVDRRADRAKVLAALEQRYPQNIMIHVLFSNIPNQFILFLWTNSMKQMDGLREEISNAEGVASSTLNVLQIGYMFDTWRDRLAVGDGEPVETTEH
jgi:DNA-binding Lrp family transcriptional regulator